MIRQVSSGCIQFLERRVVVFPEEIVGTRGGEVDQECNVCLDVGVVRLNADHVQGQHGEALEHARLCAMVCRNRESTAYMFR